MRSRVEDLVEKFYLCTLPKQEWTHKAHLKVGLWHLLHYLPDESLSRLRQGIKKYNVACGIENTDTQGYHETITRFYVCIIKNFLQQIECDYNIEFLAEQLINQYGDKLLLFTYYSREKLFSKKARREWVEPDLKPLNEL